MADFGHDNPGDNATRGLARFAATLTFDMLPAAVIQHVKRLILDGIGVCLRGAALP